MNHEYAGLKKKKFITKLYYFNNLKEYSIYSIKKKIKYNYSKKYEYPIFFIIQMSFKISTTFSDSFKMGTVFKKLIIIISK